MEVGYVGLTRGGKDESSVPQEIPSHPECLDFFHPPELVSRPDHGRELTVLSFAQTESRGRLAFCSNVYLNTVPSGP